MDAGLSRFFEDLNLSAEYPGEFGKKTLLNYSGKLLVQCFAHSYPDLFFSKTLDKNYLTDNRSFVMGGMFAGSIESINTFDSVVEEHLTKMLDNKIVNNEQILLGYLVKNNPDLFAVFVNEYPHKRHRNYELIHVLGR